MYKYAVLLWLFACLTSFCYSQTTREQEVNQTIEKFFEAFHRQDTSTLRSMVSEHIVLTTMGVDPQGQNRIRTDRFEDFLSSIGGIPDSLDFREELLDIEVKLDGPMAHAWTPYKFWVNGQLSHCGVNSFQLFDNGADWKIVYLGDTRRREGCE